MGRVRRPLTAAITGAALTVTLGACGGGTTSSSTTSATTTSAASTTSSTHTGTTHGGTGAATLREVVAAGRSSPLGPSAHVHHGQAVAFETVLPPGASKLKLSFDTGPGNVLHATAHAKGQTASAQLQGSGPITLIGLRYRCELPPAPSVCPDATSALSPHGVTLTLRHLHMRAVVLAGLIGPGPAALTKGATPGTASMAPYAAAELLRVTSHGHSAGRPGSAVKVGPGDIVTAVTVLRGATGGAPQPVTVTITRSSGKTLTVGASTKGGQVSRAAIESTGPVLKLLSPAYGCLLPPAPTFCPAKDVHADPRSWSVTFLAAPGLAPIALSFTAAKG